MMFSESSSFLSSQEPEQVWKKKSRDLFVQFSIADSDSLKLSDVDPQMMSPGCFFYVGIGWWIL